MGFHKGRVPYLTEWSASSVGDSLHHQLGESGHLFEVDGEDQEAGGGECRAQFPVAFGVVVGLTVELDDQPAIEQQVNPLEVTTPAVVDLDLPLTGTHATVAEHLHASGFEVTLCWWRAEGPASEHRLQHSRAGSTVAASGEYLEQVGLLHQALVQRGLDGEFNQLVGTQPPRVVDRPWPWFQTGTEFDQGLGYPGDIESRACGDGPERGDPSYRLMSKAGRS